MSKKIKIVKSVLAKPKQIYNINQWYSFTINAQSQFWKHNGLQRVKKLQTHYKEILSNISDYCEFNLTPEMSKVGRWHYHGTIRWTDEYLLFMWLLVGVNKLTNTSVFEIDTINNMDHWNKYCSKDKAIMSPQLKQYELNHLNLKPQGNDDTKNTFLQYGFK